MFEKLGLPPKPSLKGNEWVLDASHCQGCTSAFTFFNRKHHCRRCGGIFCGNCTQQRMNLRGQGEGPARVCDPCKKLEDAAKLEARSGYRQKVSKGAIKSSISIDSDPLLKELLGQDLKPENAENMMDEVSKFVASKHAGSTSAGDSYNAENNGSVSAQVTPELLLQRAHEQKQQWLALKKEGKGDEALEAFKRSKELERQAENLKLSIRRSQRKAVTLTTRKEKHEEIRKTEPKPKTRDLGSEDAQGGTGNSILQAKTKQGAFNEGKEKKDDLMDSLKELGWNDEDLQDAGATQNKAKTVESELAELTAAVHHGSGNNRQKSTSSMEVLAHKRKALVLKREGHLAEAKEELKKAKLLEKQLEEHQLLGDEEDESDDDLRALIHDMDKETGSHSMDAVDMDFSVLFNIHEEDDQGFEVTDVDMDDPEMIAALKLMGWEDEGAQIKQVHQSIPANPRNTGRFHKPQGASVDFLGGYEINPSVVEATEEDMKDPYFLSALKAMGFEEEEPSKLMHPVLSSAEDKRRLQQEILFLKKEALALKRVGKLGEAKEELRRAKHLEKHLQEVKSQYTDEDVLEAFSVQQAEPYHGRQAEARILQETLEEDTANVDVTEEDMGDPALAKTLKALGWQDDHESDDCLAIEVEPSEQKFGACHNSKSKSELQKELLGVKRAALKLRREGKLEEAEDELKKAGLIEQLMEEAGRVSIVKEAKPTDQELLFHTESKGKVDAEEIIMEVSNIGGHSNEKDSTGFSSLSKIRIAQAERSSSATYDKAKPVFFNTGRESDYGSEEQHMQLSKVGTGLTSKPGITPAGVGEEKGFEGKCDSSVMQASCNEALEQSPALLPLANLKVQTKESVGLTSELSNKMQDTVELSDWSSTATILSSRHALQQEILSLKRQALALKREGRQLEAKEKLRDAKLLERMLMHESTAFYTEQVLVSATDQELEPVAPATTSAAATSSSTPTTAVHKSAGKDRMKLQQESLAHKRKALALRREGKTEAADVEFELAKSIEKQMEELGSTTEVHSGGPKGDDLGSVDDIFDPQLLAALKGLGWKESDIHPAMSEVIPGTIEKPQEVKHKKSTEVTTSTARLAQSTEKEQLEQKIKLEKIRALQLKRSGQQAEALEVLRGAKLLERKLQSLN